MGKGGGSGKGSRVERRALCWESLIWDHFRGLGGDSSLGISYPSQTPVRTHLQTGRLLLASSRKATLFLPIPQRPCPVSALFFDLCIGNQPPPPTKTWKHETPPW